MASARFFAIFKRAQTLNLRASSILERTYWNIAENATDKLYSRIMPLGAPDISVAPLLDQWLQEGGNENPELRKILRVLRDRGRYGQALEVSEWMSSNKLGKLSRGDHAVHLDLVGIVHGMEYAESYFKNLNDMTKDHKTYGALLTCYVREGHVEKALSHMCKMKKLGFLSFLSYNSLMNLYTRTGQLEKVPDLLSDMKDNGISPDVVSYRICMNSYGERSNVDGVEKMLQEMESQSHITMDWLTYVTVANIYAKAGMKEKSLIYLRRSEELSENGEACDQLISTYANLGNKDEMMRVWGLAKTKAKKLTNRNYTFMLSGLVKLGEFEECEKMLEEWEKSCLFYDVRVTNILLIGYTQRGLVEKAESMLRAIVGKQRNPIPNSWSIIAAGYANKQNMEKALECMSAAFAVQAENRRWRPKPELISSILSWLGDYGKVEEVEEFVRLLKIKMPKNREMYHALMKAYIRAGKPVDELLESMKPDEIDKDEETHRILGSIDKPNFMNDLTQPNKDFM